MLYKLEHVPLAYTFSSHSYKTLTRSYQQWSQGFPDTGAAAFPQRGPGYFHILLIPYRHVGNNQETRRKKSTYSKGVFFAVFLRPDRLRQTITGFQKKNSTVGQIRYHGHL